MIGHPTCGWIDGNPGLFTLDWCLLLGGGGVISVLLCRTGVRFDAFLDVGELLLLSTMTDERTNGRYRRYGLEFVRLLAFVFVLGRQRGEDGPRWMDERTHRSIDRSINSTNKVRLVHAFRLAKQA